MCGLVSIIAKANNGLMATDQNIFFDMLVINSLRGSNSTGVFGLDWKGLGGDWAKAVGSPYMAMSCQPFSNIVTAAAGYRCLVGHGRAATRGKVNASNAHPYEFDNIILAHNGTLINGYRHKEFYDFSVDSQFLAWYINEHGIEKAYADVEGAIALIFFDKQTNKLHAIRNKERPLWIADGKSKVFLSSEEATLAWLAVKYPDEKIEHPMYLKEHFLYTFNNVGGGWDCRELKPFVAPPATPIIYPRQERTVHRESNHLVTRLVPIEGGKKIKEVSNVKIKGQYYTIGDDIPLIVDDVKVIYDKDNSPTRILVYGSHPLDLEGTVAQLTANIAADKFTEDDFYSADSVIIKIKKLVKRKGSSLVHVTGDIINTVKMLPYKGKKKDDDPNLKLCTQCNGILGETPTFVRTVNGEVTEVLCLACSGGSLQ